MRHSILTTILVALLLGSGIAPAQSPESLLRAAIDKELVDGDLKAAIADYRKILDAADASRDVKAQALLHLGDCHRKLGNAEARRYYDRLLREYADQSQPAGEARARIQAMSGAASGEHRLFGGSGYFGAGAPSDDGRYIPYGLYRDNAWHCFDTATGESVPLLPPSQHTMSGAPRLSPEGAKVAYAMSAEPRLFADYQIYVADRGGANAINVTPGAAFSAADALAWHPSGQQILAAVGTDGRLTRQIIAIDISSRTHRVLYQVPNGEKGWLRRPTYTPGGRYIVGLRNADPERRESYLSIMPAAGGEPVRLLDQPARHDLLGITADGRLFYTSDRSGTADIWSFPIRDGKRGGEPILVKRNVEHIRNLGLVPDGRYFYGTGTSDFGVYTARLDPATGRLVSGPQIEPTPFPGAARNPAYSRDGALLAYVSGRPDSGRYEIRIRTLATGEERDLPPSLRGVNFITWYPDGRALLLDGQDQRRRYGFFRLEAQTGELSTVIIFTDEIKSINPDGATNPTFTPDGKAVVFRRIVRGHGDEFASFLSTLDLATGAIRNVYDIQKPHVVRLFALSPDGRHIALGLRDKETANDSIAVVPFAGGQPRVLFKYPNDEYQRAWAGIAWSADGKAIFCHRDARPGDEVWRYPVDGGASQKLFSTGIVRRFAVHPDGRRLTFEANIFHSEVWVMENLAQKFTQ